MDYFYSIVPIKYANARRIKMGREIVIVNNNNERIPVKELFGKDSARLVRACCNIMENWLYPYKNCYLPANRPALPYLKEWYKEHPDEKEKRDSSRKDWEAQRDKQFRIVYGIAKHHLLYYYFIQLFFLFLLLLSMP